MGRFAPVEPSDNSGARSPPPGIVAASYPAAEALRRRYACAPPSPSTHPLPASDTARSKAQRSIQPRTNRTLVPTFEFSGHPDI